jgi:hypothetical protein
VLRCYYAARIATCILHDTHTVLVSVCMTHTVPLLITTDCAVCAKGYSNSIGYECTQCKGGTKAAIFTGVLAVLALCMIGIAFLARELLEIGDSDDAVSTVQHCSILHKLLNLLHKLSKFHWGKLRIPVVAFQIVTQYISITGLPLPNIYRKFLSWTDMFNLNLGWLLSLGCLTKINFYQKLLITTLGPFAVAAALATTYATVRRRNKVQAVDAHISQRAIVRARTMRLERALTKHHLVFLAMTFLLYSTVSTTVFQIFACDTIDDSASHKTGYLRADYSIQCGTAKHTLYSVYAGFMVIIYPLGIPALYAWLLWRNRHKLSSQAESSVHMFSRHTDDTLRSTRFLWKSYTPNMYYWEVIECVRRLLLTGAIVFIAPGTSAQAAVACVLAVASLTIAVYCRPHAEALDGQIYTVGAVIIFLSMFLSLAMKTNVSTETHSSQDAFAVVLVVLNVVMIIVAVVQVGLVGHRAITSSRQNSVLGLRKVGHSRSRSSAMLTVSKAAAVAAPAASVVELCSDNDSNDDSYSVENGNNSSDDTCKQQTSPQAALQC